MVCLLVKFVPEAAAEEQLQLISAPMSCRMVLGRSTYKDEEFSERGFKSVIQEGLQLGAAPNLGDCIPSIAPVVIQGFTKRMKAVHKAFDDLGSIFNLWIWRKNHQGICCYYAGIHGA